MHSKLPILVLKDMLVFPGSEIRIELEKEELNIINLCAKHYENQILVVMPNNVLEEYIDEAELPKYGILSQIKMKINMPNGKTRVVIAGRERCEVKSYSSEKEVLANVKILSKDKLELKEELAYVRKLVKEIDAYIKEVPYVSNSVISQMAGVSTLDELTDIITVYLPISMVRKLEYLKESSAIKRAMMIFEDIKSDLEILSLEKDIDEEVNRNLEETQIEFILKEKMKVIKSRLGEDFDKDSDIDDFKDKINKLKAPKKIKEKLDYELKRYSSSSIMSPEAGMIRTYIETLLSLPYENKTKDETDLNKVKERLDKSHFALGDVKERIIEYLAVKENSHSLRSPILCLVGPPGVGKTTLAKSIAKSIGRKVAKISVGGINDEAEIIGHRRTYVGARPGLIINGMKKAGTINPVFIIDEIDKMTKDIKGDPASALLEVLDREQNMNFIDHYIEEEYNLSEVLFITTANYIEQIPSELKDRLEIVNVSSYTEFEKLEIAKNYLMNEQLIEHGLSEGDLKIDDKALLSIIRNYTKEAGVRELTRQIAKIMRKFVKSKLTSIKELKNKITEKDLVDFLGNIKYAYNSKNRKKEVGIVNGLSYTPFGGDLLQIEANYYEGKGELLLTGSLGEILKESAKIAFSYIKSHVKEFNIDSKILKTNDFHIHVPEGAVPKDGPSAGIALVTVLISAMTEKKFDTSIAMTGEISLRGKILPIGGLKEKAIAAHRAGISKIILPVENARDLDEIPTNVKDEIEFILVSDYSEVYMEVFDDNK